jgi:exopolyphosphatase/guanosine-5'-triphosphate,3'-diphosphate pyrophosphatase
MRIAVIDLGTNTFNLIIAQRLDDNTIEFLFRTKRAVLLGKDGINRHYITNEAMSRALNVLSEYRNIVAEYGVEKIIAIGTSAFRTANNSDDLINEVSKRFNISIQIISGDREAEYIYWGIRQSIEQQTEPFLIIDIGGGSNELIIANSENILWEKSYPIGMARLKEKFQLSAPCLPSEISVLENYFSETLSDFFVEVQKYPIHSIIGAEGAFESFQQIAAHHLSKIELVENAGKATVLPLEIFNEVHQLLISSSLEERGKINGLELFRVEMIVLASIFVEFILKKLNWPKLYVSSFSLKEGVVWEYFYTR